MIVCVVHIKGVGGHTFEIQSLDLKFKKKACKKTLIFFSCTFAFSHLLNEILQVVVEKETEKRHAYAYV
jgi:hypothetical protein